MSGKESLPPKRKHSRLNRRAQPARPRCHFSICLGRQRCPQLPLCKLSPAERRRVLDDHRAGRPDWLTVAVNNGISRATAYRIIESGRVEDLPRGGARQELTKVTHKALNLYCKRGRGRAKKGERPTLSMPPSKGANLQVQCAVNSVMGVVLYRLQRGSIKMQQNAAFIDDIYRTVKVSPVFQQNYQGKKIVVDLDNAPSHRQTEQRVSPDDDLILLRLAPYSPMCNPIEGCFSVLKSHIKNNLTVHREEICNRDNMTDFDGNVLTIKERTMRFLERAALNSIQYIIPTVVLKMELHARDSVNTAEVMQDILR
ncbi:hypothetical protein PHMEG_0008341 [Phytophthora megakarya]|uniref:Tc1-like transposase DDE domain-containing protein n=1 Tax=Phytophthora megakarya TaxID=4795 RepID=A0A225WJ04_9STRA|nr:hypothetical protein PHMEG_0008341 [Phytophthora megakarya]